MVEKMDPGKPRTWVRFRKGMCNGCSANCCHDMPVQVSVPDLVRLGGMTAEEAAKSLPHSARSLRKKGWIRPFTAGSLIFVLRQKRNLDCIFLNENRQCTVYERRPEICRQFPKISPRPGYCPHEVQG